MENLFFVERLEELNRKDDKAALAEIRRAAANPDDNFLILRIIGSYLPSEVSNWELDIYKRLACLYAIHKGHINKDYYNFGVSCRKIWLNLDAGKESFESRFAALLNCRPEDLYRHLLSIVRFASDKGVKINFNRLFKDMKYWAHPDKFAQKNWAKQFWTIKLKEEETEN